MTPFFHEPQYLVENATVSSVTGSLQNYLITVKECYELIHSKLDENGVIRESPFKSFFTQASTPHPHLLKNSNSFGTV